MLTLKEDSRINCKIAQFNHVILEERNKTVRLRYLKQFIEEIGNINSTVTKTNFKDWIGYTVLHFTAFYSNNEVFLLLLDRGADITLKNNDENTALHLAFNKAMFEDNEDIAIIMAHLKNNNFENICNQHGFSYFHIACIVNNVELVQHFLANGVSVNQAVASESQFYPAYTPLHFAVHNDAFEVAEVLLFHGANIHAKDSTHVTPLHILLINFHISNLIEKKDLKTLDQIMKEKIQKLLGLILKFYADTEMIIIDDVDLSNLHVACTLEDLTAAESILNKVTNINHCINVNSHLWQGYTALHFAALSNVEAVKLLMRNGADIDFKDAKGVTAFDLCIKRFGGENIHAIISLNPLWRDIVLSDGRSKLLDLVSAMRTSDELDIFLKEISRGKDVDIKVHIPNDSPLWPGFSLMHLATALSDNTEEKESIEETSFQLLRTIYKQNPHMLHSQDLHGQTPLHLACKLDKQNVINLLIEFYSFNNNWPNLVDEDGLSDMHIACANENTDFLKKLLVNNSNVNTVYKGKSMVSWTILPQTTALHIAVANDSVEMVQALIQHGADVNAKDENDMTPIHLAFATSKNNEIITTLLSSSELIDSSVSGIGLSHLHVAAYYDDIKAVEKLIATGTNIEQILNKANEFERLSKYEGFTPLAFAINVLSFDVAEYLLKHGADIFLKMPSGNLLLYETMSNYSLLLLPNLFKDVLLENRVRMEIGLTKLHFACFKHDYNSVKDLLNNGADVNAQLHKNLPRWSGFTPLHVLMFHPILIDEDFEKIFELLIHKGADVTLSYSGHYSETPIHLAHSMLLDKDKCEIMFPYVNKLLEAQRDYSKNPANYEGYTHFHIACSLCNTTIIEKFLRSANIDVNQPLDCFTGLLTNGSAMPLQLSLDNKFSISAMQRLRTAKLLLTHGAEMNITNLYGNTLLYSTLFHSKDFDVFEMLVRFGADVNTRNLDGKTPLECFILKNEFSVESLKVLLRFGCQYNIYDASTEVGYIGLTLKSISYKAMNDFIPALIENFPHLIKEDGMNRTVIHNIVSVREFEISDCEYATLIKELMLAGCDVDDQDNAGRTALHLAAKFYNFPAILGLLMAGADANTTDSTGKTAFTCDFAFCDRRDRNGVNNDTDNVNDQDNVNDVGCNNKKCEHFKTFETFAVHVKKLQLCGLDVHPLNENLVSEAYQKFPSESLPNERFSKELEELKNVKIGLYSLTLFDFMSENGAIVNFPYMPQMKQNAVHNVFSQTSAFREKFSETWGILQLQYRKAVARVQLVEKGRNSLTILIGFRLHEICSQKILKFLKNSELKILILAGENDNI